MSEFVFIPLATPKLCGNCQKNSKFGGVVYSIPKKRLKNIAVCSEECVLAIFRTGAFGTEGQFKAGLFADTQDTTTTSDDIKNATENVNNGQQNILSNDNQSQEQQQEAPQSLEQQDKEQQEMQQENSNEKENQGSDNESNASAQEEPVSNPKVSSV